MTVRRDTFPFAPLDSAVEEHIIEMCGGGLKGYPLFIEGFRRFLAKDGHDGIPLPWYRQCVSTLGADCLEALDISAPSAQRNANRAMLLYAGVANVIAAQQPQSPHKMPESPLPINSDMLRTAGDTHRTNLAVAALQGYDEIPDSFGHLMGQFSDVFTLDDGRVGLEAARVGAGLLHLITVGSGNAIEAAERDRLAPDPAALQFAALEYDKDLERLFSTTRWPDQETPQ